VPLLAVLAPVRQSDTFRRHAALFVAERWASLPVGPWRLGPALAAVLALAGVALYLRDLVPALLQGLRMGRHVPDADPRDEEIGRRVAAHAAHLDVNAPEARLVQDEEGCTSLPRRPLRRFSSRRGGLATASPEGWMPLSPGRSWRGDISSSLSSSPRSLLLFNPVAQIVGRSAVLEMERAADDASAAATGRPAALASALAKLGVLAGDDGPAVPGGFRFDVLKGRLVRLSEKATTA
jgi:hypothetical protein